MENRLQELTEKLYNEGLSRGKDDGAAILAKAKSDADSILASAREEASVILAKAKSDALQLASTTRSEIQLASNQMVSALRQQIAGMLTASVFEPQIKDSYRDGSYVKELMIKAVESFNVEGGVQVIVPEGFDGVVRDAVLEKLNGGVEIVTSGKVKVPFRIAPVDGSYVVSFSDEDFDSLFKSYIRPMVNDLLYK